MCGGGANEIKETQGEKDIAQIAAEKWNHWYQNIRPMEDEFIDRVQMRDHDYKRAAGFANVDNQAAYGKVPAVTTGAQNRQNLAVGFANRGLAKGRSAANNLTLSQAQTDDRHTAGLSAIISAGQGLDVQAQNHLSQDAAMNFGRAAHKAQMDQARSNLHGSAFASAAGAAAYGAAHAGRQPSDTIDIDGMTYDLGTSNLR